MLKPTSTYKMSKQTKRSLALSKWKSTDQKNAWKRAMIQAELASKIVIKPNKQERGPRGTANYTTTSNSATASD